MQFICNKTGTKRMGREDATRNYGHWGRRRERVRHAWYDYPTTCLDHSKTPKSQNPRCGTTINWSVVVIRALVCDVQHLPVAVLMTSLSAPILVQPSAACCGSLRSYMKNVEIMKN